MATHRIHRLLRLIILLQGGQAKSAKDLIEELGVSRRTLFRDLKMLEMAGIPYYHDRLRGYRIQGHFYLPPINLTATEALALMLAGKSVAARGDRATKGATLSAINKLISTVPEPVRTACTDLIQHVSIDYGAAPVDGAGEQHFFVLQRCVDEGRSCRVTYKGPLEDVAFECRFDPYALHFATRAWYVLGWSHLHDEVRTFKLSRIQTLQSMDKRFRKPRRFEVSDKLGQAWQLIPEGKIYQVTLEFSARVATNVSEIRWHPSQKDQMLPDGRCRISFTVDGLGEIAWWLCGYADQVTVVRPAALRNRVREMLQAAVENHSAPARRGNSPK